MGESGWRGWRHGNVGSFGRIFAIKNTTVVVDPIYNEGTITEPMCNSIFKDKWKGGMH